MILSYTLVKTKFVIQVFLMYLVRFRFNPVKSIVVGILLERIKPKAIHKPIQDVCPHFLVILQETNYFIEQSIVVSSEIGELCKI